MEYIPYDMQRPDESNYIVAYFDVLGTKEYIQKGESEKIFEAIYDIYVMTTKIMSQIKAFNFDSLVFKIFSDNILVAIRTEKEDVPESYKIIIDFLKMFLNSFLNVGIFFRGGITFSKLAIDDIIVWGKGLTEVVYLEEKIAVYPRIVLSESLAKLLADTVMDTEELEEKYNILEDVDGCCYLDYVIYKEPHSEKTIKNSYNYTVEKLKTETNPSIRQKYKWHLNYLEHAKEKFNCKWAETSFEVKW